GGDGGSQVWEYGLLQLVMAGPVPAIHGFALVKAAKTWMPATSAGMTIESSQTVLTLRGKLHPASSFFTIALALEKSIRPAKRSLSAAMVRPMSLSVAASSSLISAEMASPASMSDNW